MPSPLGHLLGGAAVYLTEKREEGRSNVLLASALVGSIVPDFDFVPGLVVGDMRAFHHGMSHSFAFAILFGVVMFVIVRLLHSSLARRAAIVGTLAYASHVLLDLVSVNPGTLGVALFWPASNALFGVNLHVFGYFHYTDEGISSVLHWSNLLPLMREAIVLGLLVIFLAQKRPRRHGSLPT